MPPPQYWHCAIISFLLFFGSMSSTLFILNMTFERFYSIIQPHKAASFNTYKRAKFSIIIIIIFSFLYNIPHFFISSNTGKLVCNAYGKAIKNFYGQMYYWFSFTLNFALPFVLLLMMNTVIIHILRKRSAKIKGRLGGQGQTEGETMKNHRQANNYHAAIGYLWVSNIKYTWIYNVVLHKLHRCQKICSHLCWVLFILQCGTENLLF